MKGMRRLAADISTLHNQPLPPNYLFAPDNSEQDDLTQLDILLAGPAHTPFSQGVWRLHLSIPVDYPAQPPTANFRTPIFHPNVHPETGGVCVETLKRDWDSKLTLRDVLITISCLLIQPNPDSALNAEAGSLIQEDYEMFARRARLLTGIHANVPASMATAVEEARNRGQESASGPAQQVDSAPVRQRRQMAGPRQRMGLRESDGSPTSNLLDRRHAHSRTQHQERDDVFQTPQFPVKISSDDAMNDVEQENHGQLRAPALSSASTPKRPPGPPVPLGELSMSSDEDDMEPEYPPSPKKSPTKSLAKSPVKRQLFNEKDGQQDTWRTSQTPPNLTDRPMHAFTPFRSSRQIEPGTHGLQEDSSMHTNVEEEDLEQKLWSLCGDEVSRWNSCDFDQQPFEMVAARW